MDIKGTRGLLTFWRGGWVPRGPTNNPSHVPAACFDLGQLPPTPIFDPSTLKRRPKPLGFREYVHARVIPIAAAHSVACVAA